MLTSTSGRVWGTWNLLGYVFTENGVKAGDEKQSGRKDREDVSSEERNGMHCSIDPWRATCSLPNPSSSRKSQAYPKAVGIYMSSATDIRTLNLRAYYPLPEAAVLLRMI